MTRWQRRFELDDSEYPELYQFTEELKDSREFAPFMRELLDIAYHIRRKNDVFPLLESKHLREAESKGGAVLDDLLASLQLLDMVERCDIESLFSAYPELMLETIRFMRSGNDAPQATVTTRAQPQAQAPKINKTAFKTVDVQLNEDELLKNTFDALDDLFGD